MSALRRKAPPIRLTDYNVKRVIDSFEDVLFERGIRE